MKAANFDVQVLIQYLQGTCNSLAEGIERCFGEEMTEDDLTENDHLAIDNEIFLCEECGWWCEICEHCEDDEAKCSDCFTGNDD